MPTKPLALAELLALLDRHAVRHVVVGAVAAAMAGAPLVTFDLDIVYQDSAENLDRLADALVEAAAEYRDPGGRRIRPTRERLATLRTHLLETRLGNLDLLRSVGANQRFEDLERRSHRVMVGQAAVTVLDLEAVIETKEQAGRPKDLAALPVLRETLREIERRRS